MRTINMSFGQPRFIPGCNSGINQQAKKRPWFAYDRIINAPVCNVHFQPVRYASFVAAKSKCDLLNNKDESAFDNRDEIKSE